MKKILFVLIALFSQLSSAAQITGTITAPDTSPVENVNVVCFSYGDWIADAWTNAAGQYTVNDLTLDENYTVVAYPPAASGFMLTMIDITLSPDPLTGVDIQLDAGGLTISGTVTDKDTGLPVNNVWVGAWLDDDAYSIYGGGSATNASGYYQLTGLPPVGVEIFTQPSATYAKLGTSVDLTASVTGIDIALPLAASISGVLIDNQTAQPIPDVEIEYWNEQYVTWTNAVTDPNGQFTMTQLPPGIAEVMALPQVDTGYVLPMTWPSIWVNIAEGQDLQNRVITLQKGAMVYGYIKSPAGVPHAWTEFNYMNKMTEGWGQTDQDGYFEMRLPVGDNGLSIELDDGGYSTHSQALNITSTTTPIDLGDITIYSPTDGAQITGSILNPTAASYQGEFEISAMPAGLTRTPANFGQFNDTCWGELSGSGPYTLQSLPPGNYDLYLWHVDEIPQGPEMIAIRDIVYNVSTGSSNIDLTYDSQGGIITGNVINQYGDPILGAVTLLNDSTTGNFAGVADTDADGGFTVHNFQPGTYTLTMIHPMYINQQAPSPVTVTLATTTTVPTITMDFLGNKIGPDLNGDGHTDVADAAIFASKWMTADIDANFDQQNMVELPDLAIISKFWLTQAIWYNTN